MTDITGTFTAEATLENDFADPMMSTYDLDIDQTGVIPDGSATVQIGLIDPTNSGASPSFPMPVAIDPDGTFAGTVEGLVIPAMPMMGLNEPSDATLAITAEILTDDCIVGEMALTLLSLNVTSTGPFRASRAMSAGCDGAQDAPDMGAHAEDMTDSTDMGGL